MEVQPAEHYNGTVYITYDVTDGIANTAASTTFDLAAVNDVPELTGTKAVLDPGIRGYCLYH